MWGTRGDTRIRQPAAARRVARAGLFRDNMLLVTCYSRDPLTRIPDVLVGQRCLVRKQHHQLPVLSVWSSILAVDVQGQRSTVSGKNDSSLGTYLAFLSRHVLKTTQNNMLNTQQAC